MNRTGTGSKWTRASRHGERAGLTAPSRLRARNPPRPGPGGVFVADQRRALVRAWQCVGEWGGRTTACGSLRTSGAAKEQWTRGLHRQQCTPRNRQMAAAVLLLGSCGGWASGGPDAFPQSAAGPVPRHRQPLLQYVKTIADDPQNNLRDPSPMIQDPATGRWHFWVDWMPSATSPNGDGWHAYLRHYSAPAIEGPWVSHGYQGQPFALNHSSDPSAWDYAGAWRTLPSPAHQFPAIDQRALLTPRTDRRPVLVVGHLRRGRQELVAVLLCLRGQPVQVPHQRPDRVLQPFTRGAVDTARALGMADRQPCLKLEPEHPRNSQLQAWAGEVLERSLCGLRARARHRRAAGLLD